MLANFKTAAICGRFSLVAVIICLNGCGVLAPAGEEGKVFALAENPDPIAQNMPELSSEKPDSDGDGLIDEEEILLGTDPANPDSDSDQLTDGEEVRTYFTDPNSIDTDGDTQTDYDEIHVLPALYPLVDISPTNPDDDGDGFHPLVGQNGFPVQADCNNFDFSTHPGAPDQFGDGKNSDCVVDIPTASHVFGKGYEVTAEIVELAYDDFGVVISADLTTYPFEEHGECRINPYAQSASTACLNAGCVQEDYDLQYSEGELTGYQDDHGCYTYTLPVFSTTNPTVQIGTLMRGYNVEKLGAMHYRITASAKQNNHNSPYYVTVVFEVGD